MQKKEYDIYCNCCGKKIVTEPVKDSEDYLDIRKEWGYHSHNKDGLIHHIYLCESCYDRWTAGFALPVRVKEQTELL